MEINQKTITDDLLRRIGFNLQLNKTRKERAEESYNAVNEYLESVDESISGKGATIFPQGSYSIGTTVRPTKNSEYDLDFVYKINQIWNSEMKPIEVLEKMEKALLSNETYSSKVESKNRCVRINYVGDFHLDILPAFPVGDLESKYLKIPDRKLNTWVDTSPELYSKWFKEKAEKTKELIKYESNEVQELPDDEDYITKSSLKVAVQLVKRFKSIYFKDDEQNETPSIIITTIMAETYNGESSELQIIKNFISSVESQLTINNGKLNIPNPQNYNEKFSDRINASEEKLNSFKSFISTLKEKISKINSSESVEESYNVLYELFDEKVVKDSAYQQAEIIRERSSNRFKDKITGYDKKENISSNTFYGDPNELD